MVMVSPPDQLVLGVTLYLIQGIQFFFKRKYILTWTGPGTAIVQDGQQILTNHRSTYIRVYPYNFKLKKY